ncbi:MAG: cupredoxin domain-containing protein [Chloroflexota bacterium]|nr:cupredoxin domain-containing protein [Chloroflexota bacterium]
MTHNASTSVASRWPRRLAVAIVVVAVLGIAGALFVRAQLDLGAAVTGVTEVAVIDDRFEPAVIEIPAGTEVRWLWQGQNEHNVIGDGFESPVQAAGEFAYTFREPGTIDYQCTLHAFMRGQVIVTPDETASGQPPAAGAAVSAPGAAFSH